MNRAFVAVAAMGLSGCSALEGPNAAICSPVREFAPETASQVPDSELLSNCLHQWGYRLAPGPDGAAVVAQGVLSACALALDRAAGDARDGARASARELQAEHKKAGNAGTSLEYANLAAEWANDAEKGVREGAYKEAVFRITQGRAGKCSTD